MLSFLIKLFHVIITDVVNSEPFCDNFFIKHSLKHLLTPVRTEENAMLSQGSVLELRQALRGFHHSNFSYEREKFKGQKT